MPTCPEGHQSQSTDFCDQCGLPIVAEPAVEPTPADAAVTVCPNCGVPRPTGALFCESCGYDYTTGALPEQDLHTALGLTAPEPVAEPTTTDEPVATEQAPANPAPAPRPPSWVAEVWVDPQWYAFQESSDPLPAQGPPRIVPLHDSALIGRQSVSRQINPDIDCEPDAGVSRRQAYLTSADGHWYINDLDSANGTFVAPATAGLPTEAITARTQVTVGSRIYVGAWTRIVIRPALPIDLPPVDPAAAASAEPGPTQTAAEPADKENDGNQDRAAPDQP